MEGIVLSQPITVARQHPTDSRFGPFASTVEALAAIPETRRYLGLTVGIIDAGEVVEYWFKDNLSALESKGSGGAVAGVDANPSIVSTNPVENKGITPKVILDTNRPIGRNFTTLQGLTLNANEGGNPGGVAYIVDFLNKVFFPFINPTLAANIYSSGSPMATLVEVGQEDDILTEGVVTPNSGNLATLSDRAIWKNGAEYQTGLSAVPGEPDKFEYLDAAVTRTSRGTVTYQSRAIMEDEQGDPLSIQSAIRTINYEYPVFIGYSEIGVTPDAAAIIAGLEKLINLNSATQLQFTEDIWKSIAGQDKVRWIAFPVSGGKKATAFNNGAMDQGPIPSGSGNGPFEGGVNMPTIVSVSKPSWGGATDYLLMFTSDDGINPLALSFSYNTMTLTLGTI